MGMMLLLAAAAGLAVLVISKIPPTPGSYFDPGWITAATSMVRMVVGIYAAMWLYQMLQAFEKLLLILTGVKPEEARLTFHGTLKRMRQLIEEVTTDGY